MKSLLVRFINVAVIAIAIVGYNGILTNREKTDEIAKLDAQLESEKLARKMQKNRLRRENQKIHRGMQMLQRKAKVLIKTVLMKEKLMDLADRFK